jgi:hypothetical protein
MTTALLHSGKASNYLPAAGDHRKISERVLVLTAWLNHDSAARKGMHFAWTAAGVPIGLPAGQDKDGQKIYPVLREKLRPERRHIIPEVYPHYTSEGPIEELVSQSSKL